MSTLRLALAGIMLASVLAGCAQSSPSDEAPPTSAPIYDTPSPSQYAIKPPEEIWVTMSDGMRINNVAYRPDTAEPVPVFINFSPYWDDSAMKEGDAFAKYMIHEYVPRGYAVVLTGVRGTGHSEGCFEVGSDRETRDLNEVVDAFSKMPWSNGNIASGGKSYDSTSQNGMIAKFPHPALKGIFHVEGITDMYSYTFEHGVPTRGVDLQGGSVGFTETYSAGQGLGEYLGGAAGAGDTSDETPESLARLAGDVACAQTPQHVANPVVSTVTGLKTPYWIERDWTRSIAASSWNGSIFFVHGYQDWNVQPSHILPWLSEVQKNGKISVLGWLHQWTADDQLGGDGHVYPKRTDWNQTMLAWMDSILKGKATPLVYGYDSQATDMLFRHDAVWPPSHVVEVSGIAGEVQFPADFVAPDGGGLRITGQILVNVTATSTNPDPVLTVWLLDVGGSQTYVFNEGVLRGIYRNGLDTPAPIVPNQATTYQIPMYALDHVVLPGHHVEIRFGVTPQESVVLPTQLLGITYQSATALLPIAPTAALEPQPTLMDCFTC